MFVCCVLGVSPPSMPLEFMKPERMQKMIVTPLAVVGIKMDVILVII